MKTTFFLMFISLLMLTGCYVQHPRYVTFETVQTIELGMSYAEVNATMTMPPNDIVSKDTLGYATYIYKYRVEDVKRIPILMRKNKGIPTEGGFRDLQLTFDQEEMLVDIKGAYEEQPSEYKREKVNVNGLIASITTIITVTIPAVMLYITR
ncbi:hypothetical protein [Parvicella tangerina]|uniref:Lipoprotein n=1 Tax=Parvicella tangerina TaxID=2829795 RepID=A0A916NC08_9FLAO|nr:hypothetical protein [Parvicella tangerina]CAG5082097.1 hypothetical protein CRYO30217_01807 [Parvicella tangerina]